MSVLADCQMTIPSLLANTEGLETCLKSWFQTSVPRTGTGVFDPTATDPKVACLASRIYKRGLSRLCDRTGNEIPTTPTYVKAAGDFSLLPPLSFFTRSSLADALLTKNPAHRYFVIDRGFAKLWPEWEAFASAFPHNCYLLEATEHGKTLGTVLNILEHMPDQCSSIFAAGGGITSDLTGFVAGLTGKPFDALATTLLSAVDAAIGGKTGANFPPFGKNQVGLFVPARSLIITSEYFGTLSSTAFICGLVEALKHAWLAGNFEQQRPLLEGLLMRGPQSPSALTDTLKLVVLNYEIKARVVMSDPLEQGMRKILNLGHTLGHCLEGLAEAGAFAPQVAQGMPHGVAVALGLWSVLDAGLLANEPEGFRAFLEECLRQTDAQPTLAALVSWQELVRQAMPLLTADKKNSTNAAGGVSVQFVLPPYGALKKSDSPDSPWLCAMDVDTIKTQLLGRLINSTN